MFIIVLFLIFEIPFISNAAGIYDNNLMSANNKKEKFENIKDNKINAVNNDIGKSTSEYDIELLSILKKNIMIQKMQDKPSSYQQYYLTDAGRNNYVQFTNSKEIDAQILLETEMVWKEIKEDLIYLNIILNKIDILAKNFLDEYLDENIDSNYVLITDINNIRQPKRKRNFYENQNMLSGIIYQNDINYKHQDNYKTLSSYDDDLNGAYGSDNKKNGDEQNILSLIYLWEKYSDIIIAVLGAAILLLIISSLIKFLTRSR